MKPHPVDSHWIADRPVLQAQASECHERARRETHLVQVRRGALATLENVLPVAPRRVKPVSRFHLKTRQLVLLVHLDDERCLARAADAAGLTQPAASKLLRQVESVLDVKLFERHARGMMPTCYGEILIRHARLALSELARAREEIAALRSGLSGQAVIGISADRDDSLVPMAVARMKKNHPGVLVSVESDHSGPLIQRLLQGELDMVLAGALDSGHADELLYEPLAEEEPYAIVAGADHPLAGRKGLHLEHLADQPWILPPAGTLTRDRLTALFRQQGVQPTNIVETLSLSVITTLLQQNSMVAALPENAVQSCSNWGLLTRLVGNLTLGMGTVGLITRRDRTLSVGSQFMLKTLRELAHHARVIENTPSLRSRVMAPKDF